MTLFMFKTGRKGYANDLEVEKVMLDESGHASNLPDYKPHR